jgi:SnoaL-like domain
MNDLDWVRSRLEIMELVSRYCLAADDRDADALVSLFVPDGRLVFPGNSPAQPTFELFGREEIAASMRRNWVTMEKSIHSIYGHVVDFSAPTAARGVVSLGSKIVSEGKLLHAARYEDEYRRVDGVWLFGSRTQYRWFSATRETAGDAVAAAFVGPAPEPPGPGSLPEAIPSWRRFREETAGE